MTIQQAMKYLQDTPGGKVRAPTGLVYSYGDTENWTESKWDGNYVFGSWQAVHPEIVKFTTVTQMGGIDLRPFIDSGDLKPYVNRRIKVTVEVMS
jgi:hypothetical protein